MRLKGLSWKTQMPFQLCFKFCSIVYEQSSVLVESHFNKTQRLCFKSENLQHKSSVKWAIAITLEFVFFSVEFSIYKYSGNTIFSYFENENDQKYGSTNSTDFVDSTKFN